MPQTTPSRISYSIDGRRVRVADLLDAGLVVPNDELVFRRPRLGEEYRGRITERGWIALDEGIEYRSSSKAAAEAAGVAAMDGWSAWVVERLGLSLFDLRKQLLDTTADEPIHQRLSDLTEEVSLTVEELLRWWDAERRGRQVMSRIKADLANHGLISVPDFEKVSLDTTVTLRRRSDDVDKGEPAPHSDRELRADIDEDNEHELGLTIGNLVSAQGELTSVRPNDSFAIAMSHMSLNDYWQLPIITGLGELRGAVTWQSLAEAALVGRKAQAQHAAVEAPVHDFDKELIDVLPELVNNGFVLVRDSEGELGGIVTMADVVNAYGSLATPFVVVGEIDHLLRRILALLMTEEELSELASTERRQVGSFDDLTFGDYQNLLGRRAIWNQLPTAFDRKVFGKRLDEVRIYRNALAHFEPDPVTDQGLDQLRRFLEVVRQLLDDMT